MRSHLSKKANMIFRAFLAALVFFLINSTDSYAKGQAGLSLPVSQVFQLTCAESIPESGEEVTYRLTPAKGAQAPLPGGTSEKYEFVLKGNEKRTLDEIRYTNVGIYEYDLTRILPEKVEGFTYDNTVYRITVQVVWNFDDGVGKLVPEWVISEGSGEKAEELIYEHDFQGKCPPKPEEPTPQQPGSPAKPNGQPGNPKTGDESNLLLYVELFAVAAVGFGILLYIKRKRQEGQE